MAVQRAGQPMTSVRLSVLGTEMSWSLAENEPWCFKRVLTPSPSLPVGRATAPSSQPSVPSEPRPLAGPWLSGSLASL